MLSFESSCVVAKKENAICHTLMSDAVSFNQIEKQESHESLDLLINYDKSVS